MSIPDVAWLRRASEDYGTSYVANQRQDIALVITAPAPLAQGSDFYGALNVPSSNQLHDTLEHWNTVLETTPLGFGPDL